MNLLALALIQLLSTSLKLYPFAVHGQCEELYQDEWRCCGNGVEIMGKCCEPDGGPCL